MTTTTTTPGRPADTVDPLSVGRLLIRGALVGMVAGAAMAMVAMVVAVTCQHRGFFTPLLHLSALLGTPDAMMRSVAEASAGHRFWIAPGPALLGLATHMVVSAVLGAAFVIAARRLPIRWVVPAGAAYGLVVFLAMSSVGLPAAAHVTGAGPVVADMASIVGWWAFAVEHLVFGTVLGTLAAVVLRHDASSAVHGVRDGHVPVTSR